MLKDDLLKGAKAAAEYIGIDTRTVFSMVEKNTIPSVRKGRMIFFRKSELDKAFTSDEAA